MLYALLYAVCWSLCAVCCELYAVCYVQCAYLHVFSATMIQSLINSILTNPCPTGGGLSVNYSSDEVTPTLQEYASQLFEVCPNLSSTPPSVKSIERGERRARSEDGDADDERPRLTIITGAIYLPLLPFPPLPSPPFPSHFSTFPFLISLFIHLARCPPV